MSESGPDFFEEGKTYTDPVANDPYKAPEQCTVFRCDAVIVHPQSDVRYAVGWARPGGQTDWEWQFALISQASWDDFGPWSEGDRWAGGGVG